MSALSRFFCRFAVLSVLLSGCSNPLSSLNPADLVRKQTPLICPNADVIEQAASYVDFAENRVGDVNAVRYTIHFSGLRGECALDADGNLQLDLFMLFLAQAGSWLKADTVTSAPWFLVVLHRSNDEWQVVARREFQQNVTLQRDGDTVPIREQFSITVPGLTKATVREYQIIGGFMLDDGQWNFNEENPFYFQ